MIAKAEGHFSLICDACQKDALEYRRTYARKYYKAYRAKRRALLVNDRETVYRENTGIPGGELKATSE